MTIPSSSSSSSNNATTTVPLTSSTTQQNDNNVQDNINSSSSCSFTQSTKDKMTTNKKKSRKHTKIPPPPRLTVAANTTQQESSSKRTLVLRMCFIASLTAAAVVCGLVAHTVIANLEEDVGAQTYGSIAASALEAAQAVYIRKLQGGKVMASIIGDAFPNASQWPFVALEGYEIIAKQMALLSVSVFQSLSVIVQPEQREEFENFVRKVYQKHGYAETAGHNDFGFGIWKQDSNKQSPTYSDGRLPDTNGTNGYGSPWNILVPVFLHNDFNSRNLLFNMHSSPLRGRALDWMRACTEAHASSSATLINSTNATAAPPCAVVTDILELMIAEGPSGIIMQPVYPVNDPMTLVGVVSSSLQWEYALTRIVPDYVDGLDCVISTETTSYTFVIQRGKPILKGPGDLHDRHFSRYGRTVVLHDPNGIPPQKPAATSATYTLTVYPTRRMFDVFRTNSPRVVSVGFVSIIVLCIVLFLMYDYFMKYEAHQRRQLLDMKRRFVRFISHEIRTPLNCVCMGLELLQDDMRKHSRDHHGSKHQQIHKKEKALDQSFVTAPSTQSPNVDPQHDSSGHAPQLTPTPQLGNTCVAFVDSCLDLTGDVYENTKNAVAVLDDLLNYEKIQTGTFKMEVGKVRIWDMVRKTVLQFKLQAQNKQIALHTCIGQESSDHMADHHIDFELDEESAGLAAGLQISALGDDMKLSQALRNLISNAIKFTPEGGTITVTASYKRDGLPKVKSSLAHTAFASCVRSGSVCIRVRDTGAGMSPDQLELLFREWNQQQKGSGSGLGLCITKEIIEQHGGTIAAESCGLGKGATFMIELPLYRFPREDEPNDMKLSTEGATQLDQTDDEAGAPDDIVGNTAGTTATIEINGSTLSIKPIQHRILVVEDVLSSRRLLVRLLERAGHVCSVASNGQEAIDCYLADQAAMVAAGQSGPLSDSSSPPPHIPYDTILMDSEMPLLSGPEATKELRELGCTATIVGITGNVLPADIQFFKAHGADEVLAKPVDLSLLEDIWSKSSKSRV